MPLTPKLEGKPDFFKWFSLKIEYSETDMLLQVWKWCKIPIGIESYAQWCKCTFHKYFLLFLVSEKFDYIVKRLCPYRPAGQILRSSSRFVISDHNSAPLELALDVAQLIHVTQYKEMLQKGHNHKFRRKNGKVKIQVWLHRLMAVTNL